MQRLTLPLWLPSGCMSSDLKAGAQVTAGLRFGDTKMPLAAAESVRSSAVVSIRVDSKDTLNLFPNHPLTAAPRKKVTPTSLAAASHSVDHKHSLISADHKQQTKAEEAEAEAEEEEEDEHPTKSQSCSQTASTYALLVLWFTVAFTAIVLFWYGSTHSA
jgi:hypothetical protein